MFWIALLIMAVVGVVLGAILAWGGRKFAVTVDPRVEAVTSALPGVNCGACGLPGCAGYADAVVNHNAALNLCAPGGAAAAHKIAAIMGGDVVAATPKKAISCCQGGEVHFRFEYAGVQDCRAATLMGIAGGRKACTWGCLGFGTCAKACPFGAITMGKDRLPVVDEKKCTGCGRCVEACPRGINRVDPVTRNIFVKCMSHDKGAYSNKVCSHGCIACRKCEKECPSDAIHVINNLAVIDYAKCTDCGKCATVCPKQVIVDLRAARGGSATGI